MAIIIRGQARLPMPAGLKDFLLQELPGYMVPSSFIDSTNNLAERLLWFGILWRKRSQGSGTSGGLRFVERILSVKQTLTI